MSRNTPLTPEKFISYLKTEIGIHVTPEDYYLTSRGEQRLIPFSGVDTINFGEGAFLSRKNLASLLNCSPSSITNYARRFGLEKRKEGRAHFYHIDLKIAEKIKSGEKTAPPETPPPKPQQKQSPEPEIQDYLEQVNTKLDTLTTRLENLQQGSVSSHEITEEITIRRKETHTQRHPPPQAKREHQDQKKPPTASSKKNPYSQRSHEDHR